MSDRKRFLYLILIMTTVALLVMGITDYILYQAAYKEEQERLVETVQSQARLMEAVARFDAIYSNDYSDGWYLATVSQITEAHKNYKGFGETGEFTLAKLVGDSIVFLLSHRHSKLEKSRSIPIGTELARPMQLALSGKSGTITGLDYRGENVLAAYEPVDMLHLGLVAKIDLSEIRAPFIRASLIAFMSAFMIILIGSLLFLRISNPVLRRLQEYAERLEKMVAKRTKKLQESENRFRTSIENMLDCFGIYTAIRDESGRIVDFRVDYVNDAACVSNRMTREEQIGKGMCEILPAHRETGLFDEYCEVVKTGRPLSKEELVYEDVYGDQRLFRAFDIRISRLGDGFTAAWRDITKRKQAEEDFEEIFNLSPDMVGVFTPEGKLIKVNPAWEKVLGYTTEEFLNMGWAKLVHPDDVETTNKETERQLKGSSVVNFENRYKCKDGSYKTLEWQATFSKNGIVHATARDITERKATEAALRESEERYRAFFTYDLIGDFISTPEGRLLDCNPAFLNLFEFKSLEEAKSTNLLSIYPDPGIRKKMVDKVKKEKVITNYEHKMRKVTGEALFINQNTIGEFDEDNHLIRLFGCVIDVTERKQREQALRESEEKFRRLFEDSKDAIYISTPAGKLIEFNPAMLELFGYNRNEILKLKVSKLYANPEDRNKVNNKIDKTGFIRDYNLKLRKKDGVILNCLVTSTIKRNSEGSIIGYQGIIRDITESKRAEEELRLQSEIITNLSEGVYLIQASNGMILYTNPRFEEMFGYDDGEMIGKHVSAVNAPSEKNPEETAKEIIKSLNKTDVWQGEVYNIKKDGTLFWCHASVSTLEHHDYGKIWIAIHTDITERKKAEEEVYQSREQLRSLAARLQSIREEEQTRISRELHDELGHLLTALKIDLIALSEDPLIKSKPQADDLQSMISLTDNSLQTVKRISTELRPEVLDQLGLKAAITWQLEDFENRNGIKCKTWLLDDLPGLNKEKQITLFRILQEALTNITRHAGATNVKVTLNRSKEMITLTVQDDGKGFKPSKVDSIKSLGLLSMHERAYSVGGELVVLGQPDVGTTITASIPLE